MTTIGVDEEVHAVLTARAAELGVTPNDVLRQLLEQKVIPEFERLGFTAEGAAKAMGGIVAPLEEARRALMIDAQTGKPFTSEKLRDWLEEKPKP